MNATWLALTKKQYLLLTASALALAVADKAGAQVYSSNIVGYVNERFLPGNNWFENPMDYGAGSNTLSNEILLAPVGTTISLWNTELNNFAVASTWNGSSWSANLTLAPGSGAQLYTPVTFSNVFFGNVDNFDGSAYGGGAFTKPPAFAGPNGTYLLGSVAPAALSGSTFGPNTFDVFDAILGRGPQNGESFTTLDPLTQTYTTTTFMNGTWSNGEPTLGVGGAGMFNIGPVVTPEPCAFGLLLTGLGGLLIVRKRLNCRYADSSRQPVGISEQPHARPSE